MFSRQEIANLSLRAATLDERLSKQYAPDFSVRKEVELAAQRLAAWCRCASGGDWQMFSKRLKRDRLSLEYALERLGPVRLADGAEQPSWVQDAHWISKALTEAPNAGPFDLAESTSTIPFGELFHTVVLQARGHRDAAVPLDPDLLMADADCQMAQQLVATLSRLCAPVLYEKFAAYRKSYQVSDSHAEPGPDSSLARAAFSQFLEEMRRMGWRELFESKPVLLRLICVLVRQWIDATSEFIARLREDRNAIAQQLLGGGPQIVSAIDMAVSDLHNFGRSVYLVTFDHVVVVYKPKNLKVDQAWGELVDWLNSHSPPIDLRTARVIDRGSYGWAEYISHSDVQNLAAAGRFFRRAGAWLSLLYLMGGTDMHEENIIAAGEYPVPVDLETSLSVRSLLYTAAAEEEASEAADRQLGDSVLATGLLPTFLRERNTAIALNGGFVESKLAPASEIAWSACNSDAMRPVSRPWSYKANDNLPRLDGAIIQIGEFQSEFLQGCTAYFEFAFALKEKLSSADGPLEKFAQAIVRRVFRPTRFYALLLQRMRDHRTMHDGVAWGIQLEFINRLDAAAEAKRGIPPSIFGAERIALGALNIPFFSQPVDGRDALSAASGDIAASNGDSGLEEARRRIASLHKDQIAWQMYAARLSLIDTHFNRDDRTASSPRRSDMRRERRALDIPKALACSQTIARTIEARSIQRGTGAAWIGLNPIGDGTAWSPSRLGHDLYGGTPGIALFLAAHACVSNDKPARELAIRALAATRHLIRSEDFAHYARTTGIGGASGLGGLVYALSSIADLLEAPALADDARRVALSMNDDLVAGDSAYDVIGGSAGAILGLLKLYRQTGDKRVLGRAIVCGDHLLKVRHAHQRGLSADGKSRLLTGFSHGAAGFAYALSSLAKASDVETFNEAAKAYLSYESSVFSSERGNWPDFRSFEARGEPAWLCQWCHGAAGIGLARIGMIRFGCAGADVLNDARCAIETVVRRGQTPFDTLCCGGSGSIELLREASHVLPDSSSLNELADQRLGDMVEDSVVNGGFRWQVGANEDNLGLFSGLCGPGYALLRSAAVTKVPNLLLWG